MDMQSKWEEVRIVINDICEILENHDMENTTGLLILDTIREQLKAELREQND